MREWLPIDEVLGEVQGALRECPSLVLTAPPGAGKTTRLPVAVATALGRAGGRVVVLEPRRVAARAAARRIADENGWCVGEEVGYRVRFDRRESPRTRILVVTDGMLLAMLQQDPFLDGVAAVVIDEIHERSLECDLALAMVRRVQTEVRPELWLVVMSATLDVAPLAAFLAPCRVLEVPVRLHPVTVDHLDRPAEADPAASVVAGVRRELEAASGDILAFLPGAATILRAVATLRSTAAGLEVLPLFGALSPAEQDAALRPGSKRRVVVATNLAETSLTIPGVRTVVDAGLARVLRYDRGCELNRLETVRIARVSAEQRTGRAGRVGPGRCLRLWSEAEERSMRDREPPQVSRLELSGPVLQLLAWGETDAASFPWFEAPPTSSLVAAHELLVRLGALDVTGLTRIGREMARLPLSPRLARLVVAATREGAVRGAALAAALLEEGARGGDEDCRDLTTRVEATARRLAVSPASAARDPIGRAWTQLLRLVGEEPAPTAADALVDQEALARSLLAAYPDRLARRRSPGSERAVMVGGRGVRLERQPGLAGRDLLLAVDVEADRRGPHSEARCRAHLEIDESWLTEDGLITAVETEVDPGSGRVRAFSRRRWLDLVVREHAVAPSPLTASRALAEAACGDLERSLGLDRPEVAAFLARVRSLAGWRPDLGLPSFDAAELAELLPGLCSGRSSLAELRTLPLVDLLRSLLGPRAADLERLAPERLEVPSGSRLRLTYEPDRPPVLAVRIQELFGLAHTPTVCAGRVPVLLHLLAPNGRPQQVTDDLEGFWDRTYPQVRRELAGRYPRHAWPENPRTAPPTRGRRRP